MRRRAGDAPKRSTATSPRLADQTVDGAVARPVPPVANAFVMVPLLEPTSPPPIPFDPTLTATSVAETLLIVPRVRSRQRANKLGV